MSDRFPASILKEVSRSFYLSLRILPPSLRTPISLTYLLARAADTLTDLPFLHPDQRLSALEGFRDRLSGKNDRLLSLTREARVAAVGTPGEEKLLERLHDCFRLYDALEGDDHRRVCRLLMTLTEGMISDVSLFHGENPSPVSALGTRADLERYTYCVAGCVGEFWTEMLMARSAACSRWNAEAMSTRGVRYGQGLQMINVLRDLSHDLRCGRCYLPAVDLAALGLRPEELLDPAAMEPLRPLIRTLLQRTLELLREGWNYLREIPAAEPRLLLACCWPLFIGLKTLEGLARCENLLDPAARVKIRRPAVYGLLAISSALVLSRTGLQLYYHRLEEKVTKQLES